MSDMFNDPFSNENNEPENMDFVVNEASDEAVASENTEIPDFSSYAFAYAPEKEEEPSEVEEEAGEDDIASVFETEAKEEPSFSAQSYYNFSQNNNSQGSYNQQPCGQPGNGNQQPYGQQNGNPYNSGYQQPYQYQQQRYNFSNNPQPPVPDNKKSSGGKKIAVAVIAFAVVVAFVAMLSSFGSSDNKNTTSPVETTVSQNGESDTLVFSTTDPSNLSLMTGVQVAEKARPSVVGVMTYINGQLSGEGSGVVMSLDSTGTYTYIITCAHVINEKGVSYGVRTLEGKNYTAELVAYDTRTDIGVLKVEATDLPIAEFGDSSSLKVGEPVYAIGNPGGSEYFGSMTNGIISAIDRSITSTYTMTCIQHNAAINPGNSGGALVNSAGQVIGINSSKIAATDYEGMGFAVPMAIVKPVVDALIQYKYVPNRPKLGIEYASVSAYQLYSMVVAIKGLPAGSLVIAGISSDSSLANTEAEVGDLIIAVNGTKMDSSDVLLDLINTGAVGDTLTLTLCRVENRTYKTTTFDVVITLVEDKGVVEEETTTQGYNDGYYHGGASNFEDFFSDYFGF